MSLPTSGQVVLEASDFGVRLRPAPGVLRDINGRELLKIPTGDGLFFRDHLEDPDPRYR
jgi:hypothetical protein